MALFSRHDSESRFWKWKLIIVCWLVQSPKLFAALRKVLPGISQKILAQQLREFVNDSIVLRQPTEAVPSPVEYSLTDYGRPLLPLNQDAGDWRT